MFGRTDCTAILLTIKPDMASALATALASMGPGMPRIGRFTEAGGLLLARTSATTLHASRHGSRAALIAELAPLASLATLSHAPDFQASLPLAAPDAATRLAHLLPPEIHPERLGAGQCTQTTMGPVTVLLLCHGPDDFEVHHPRPATAAVTHAIETAMDTVAA